MVVHRRQGPPLRRRRRLYRVGERRRPPLDAPWQLAGRPRRCLASAAARRRRGGGGERGGDGPRGGGGVAGGAPTPTATPSAAEGERQARLLCQRGAPGGRRTTLYLGGHDSARPLGGLSDGARQRRRRIADALRARALQSGGAHRARRRRRRGPPSAGRVPVAVAQVEMPMPPAYDGVATRPPVAARDGVLSSTPPVVVGDGAAGHRTRHPLVDGDAIASLSSSGASWRRPPAPAAFDRTSTAHRARAGLVRRRISPITPPPHAASSRAFCPKNAGASARRRPPPTGPPAARSTAPGAPPQRRLAARRSRK